MITVNDLTLLSNLTEKISEEPNLYEYCSSIIKYFLYDHLMSKTNLLLNVNITNLSHDEIDLLSDEITDMIIDDVQMYSHCHKIEKLFERYRLFFTFEDNILNAISSHDKAIFYQNKISFFKNDSHIQYIMHRNKIKFLRSIFKEYVYTSYSNYIAIDIPDTDEYNKAICKYKILLGD